MTVRKNAPYTKERWLGLGVVVMATMLLVVGGVLALTSGTLSTAQMGGFGIEGNLHLDATTGDTYDWRNAGGDPAGTNACSALASPGFVTVGGPLHLSCANDKPTGQTDNSLNGHEQDSSVQAVCGSVPNNKSDLTNFYVANQSVVGGSSGYSTPQSFVYLGWTRVNTLGSADMDFEFNQVDQDPNLSQASCPGGNGTTISIGPKRTDGDLLVQYLFGGNSISIQLSKWITDNSTQGACATQTSAPCWGAPADLTAEGLANGAINDASTPDAFSCLTPNNKTTDGCTVNDLSGGTLLPETFGEAAINLTAALSGSDCTTLGSVYLKSRSSAVFTDAMKDYIAPIPVHITNCVTPDLSTALSSATATIGTSVTDTATLSGFLGSNPPGGTVTFNVYSSSDCTGTHTSIAGTALAASGSNATSSATITDGNDLSPGDYQVQAVYSGDGASNLGSSSLCGSEPLTINKAQPTLSTLASPASNITVGDATSISDTATFGGLVSGFAPTGSVNFTLYVGTTCVTAVSGVSGSGPITGSGPYTATYSTTWTPTAIGTYTWGISYAGDTNYKPIPTSGTGVQCGGTGETFTVVARTPGLSTVQRVIPQDKVTFSGFDSDAGAITGSVTFRLYKDVGGAGLCGSTNGTPVFSQTGISVDSGLTGTNLTYGTTNSGDPAVNGGFAIVAPTGGTFRWTVQFASTNANYSSVAESSCSSEPTVISFTNPV